MAGRLPPSAMFPAGDARFRVRYVTVGGGVTLRVVECGPADSDDIALCVHGWSCSVYSYRFLLPVLAARGVRAIACDLPGHGLSDRPPDRAAYTLHGQAASVLALMDALRIGRARLVGHSMGAPIVAWLAATAPERARTLTLLAPAGFGGRLKRWSPRWLTPRALAPIVPYLARRWMVRLIFGYAYGRLYHPTARDIDEYWAPTQFPGFTRAMWELLHDFPWTVGSGGEFDRVTAPTVVMDGTLDHLILRRWVRRFAGAIAGARLQLVVGSGHVVPEEAPELVADAMLGRTV